MHSVLLSLFLVATAQTESPATTAPAEPVAPAQPEPAATPSESSDATGTNAAPATPAPSADATAGEGAVEVRHATTDRPARRASSVPLREEEPVLSTRRLVGISLSVVGGLMSALGVGAGVATAAIEYSNWPEKPAADEYPRRSLSAITAGACAVFLIVGATVFLGGLAAVFV
ncbi:MAG: hypothetical protein AB2A00_04345 [Myxococcota bacterium]